MLLYIRLWLNIPSQHLSRWENVFRQLSEQFRSAAYQAIVPAAERILLWLEDMKGWALTEGGPLRRDDIEQIRDLILIAQQLIMKTGHLERAAGSEHALFAEFCKFIKLGGHRFLLCLWRISCP